MELYYSNSWKIVLLQQKTSLNHGTFPVFLLTHSVCCKCCSLLFTPWSIFSTQPRECSLNSLKIPSLKSPVYTGFIPFFRNKFLAPVVFFQDFPVLENFRIKFQDFPGLSRFSRTHMNPVYSQQSTLHAIIRLSIPGIQRQEFLLTHINI